MASARTSRKISGTRRQRQAPSKMRQNKQEILTGYPVKQDSLTDHSRAESVWRFRNLPK
jgi:hypothetical protein